MKIIPLMIFLVIVGVLVRGGTQWQWSQGSSATAPSTTDDPLWSVLRPLRNQHLLRLVATASATEPVSTGHRVAWISLSRDTADGVLLRWYARGLLLDGSGQPHHVDLANWLPNDLNAALEQLTTEWLAALPESTLTAAATSQPLVGIAQWRLGVWDADAAVYVTAGPDGQPGIAGADDNLSGVIDDLAELGSTGSDDQIVTPGQVGFDQAARGEITARRISRGAVVPLDPQLDFDTDARSPSLPANSGRQRQFESPSAEVWIDFLDRSGTTQATLLLE